METLAGASPNLATLVERVWVPTDDPEWPVTVSTGDLPETHLVVEEYAVLPNLSRPRFLAPLRARAANVAAFWRYNTTSSARTRLSGAALAAAYGAGLAEGAFRDRLRVGVDRRVPARQWGKWLLVRRIADELEVPSLLAHLPVRRATPNAKPTLRLFDTGGRPQGHMKLGWSGATAELVRNETRTLRAIANRLGGIDVPRIRAAGTWRDFNYLVAATFPPGVRPWRGSPAEYPSILSEIACSGRTSTGPLRDSAYERRLRDHLATVAAAEPAVARELASWLDRLVATHTGSLSYGRWHGDWVSWNLGRHGSTVLAWDWEYSHDDVPVGFDLLHWHFQHQLADRNGTLEPAVDAMDQAVHELSALGVPSSNHAVVSSLYLLEMFARAARLAAGGAGWNPRLYPDLLHVARTRDQT